ncbi:hypothetical protein M427DRAFT_158409 [Gonapodya prolifera JEL478]|uniref:Uncharacterized protein n=1 Tax=Gonapodya prolifera (strain JEL478) TaxID=1344416 RepID=A0A139A2Y0_GONPJ|nr:hypothetical protein M427DRAFT_158409 [Gonapodya prolifera JEL478]|eukprot:KXS11156.1 hypothetical protein M427DRAFT_158409 [Gonapodya prolifera JEL478]
MAMETLSISYAATSFPPPPIYLPPYTTMPLPGHSMSTPEFDVVARGLMDPIASTNGRLRQQKQRLPTPPNSPPPASTGREARPRLPASVLYGTAPLRDVTQLGGRDIVGQSYSFGLTGGVEPTWGSPFLLAAPSSGVGRQTDPLLVPDVAPGELEWDLDELLGF